MKSVLATILEVAGMGLAVAGGFLVAPALGFILAGGCAFVLGFQLEAD